MVQDASSVHHAAGGDDDAGPALGVDRLGFIGGPCQLHKRAGQRLCHTGQLGLAEVVLPLMATEDRHCLDGHRRVDPDRHLGHPTGRHQRAQQVDELLGAAHCERGDQHHAAASDGLVHHALQFLERTCLRMVTVAVGAFTDKIVARGRWGRVVVERCVVAADVS